MWKREVWEVHKPIYIRIPHYKLETNTWGAYYVVQVPSVCKCDNPFLYLVLMPWVPKTCSAALSTSSPSLFVGDTDFTSDASGWRLISPRWKQFVDWPRLKPVAPVAFLPSDPRVKRLAIQGSRQSDNRRIRSILLISPPSPPLCITLLVQ